MNKEELIQVLRQFDEKRVEELPEKTRNIFYAIVEIADERDRLNNIINELENFINNEIFTSLDKKHVFNEEADTFYKVLDKLKTLEENNKDV